MTEVNTPLLRKTLEQIVAHPTEWDQHWWAERTLCGTSFCFAGWAAVLDGAEVQWMEHNLWDQPVRAVHVADGRRIDTVALEALGISDVDNDRLNVRGEDLFATDNTMRDLFEIVNRLTGGEIEIPDELPDGS